MASNILTIIKINEYFYFPLLSVGRRDSPMREIGELSEIVHRLELFQLVYHFLKERPKSSYPEIAKQIRAHFKLNIPHHKLASAIEQLEKDLGNERLVNRTPRSKANSLTGPADELHKKAEKLLYDIRHYLNVHERVIKIGAPDMLINFVIPSIVSEFRKGQGEEYLNVEFEVSECRESEDIVEKVASGKLDFALTWLYEDKFARLQQLGTPRGLKIDKLFEAEDAGFEDPTELTFDILMICSPDHRFVREAKNAAKTNSSWTVNLKDLKDEQIIVLPARRQPLLKEIPMPPGSKGRFIEVDSFTQVLAQVRSRIKDSVGLVPSVYTEINELRRKGQIFCAPIEVESPESDKDSRRNKVSIGCVSQGGIGQLNPHAKAFLRCSEPILRRIGDLVGFEPSDLKEIPGTIEDYLRYQHCYFVMQPEKVFGIPEWFKGDLSWEIAQPDPIRDEHHYEGRLRGHLGGIFTAKTSRPWPFKVNGWLRGGDKAKNDRLFQFVGEGLSPDQKNTIICTFNMQVKYENYDTLVGVWSGRDDQGLATVAPMVLADKPFGHNISALRSIINKSSYRFLPNAEDWGDCAE
jgi:DNA-binding transcriptional LysR family regulator